MRTISCMPSQCTMAILEYYSLPRVYGGKRSIWKICARQTRHLPRSTPGACQRTREPLHPLPVCRSGRSIPAQETLQPFENDRVKLTLLNVSPPLCTQVASPPRRRTRTRMSTLLDLRASTASSSRASSAGSVCSRGTGDEGKTCRALVGVLGRLGAGREGAHLSTGAGHVRVDAFARHREPMQ